jgi:quinohemoprotein ethanol dehydrogenase
LYLSSILALNPDDGALVWYYQTTPGDTWDYTATQHIILADLNIEGQARKVLMQAPKNGFFYVLDRTAGDLISAKPYVYTNWATHVDLATGRPVETDFSRYENVNAIISPNYDGGHNWQPMAYNPETGLVYIPAMRNSHMYGTNTSWEYGKSGYAASTGWNTGTGFDASKPIRKDSLAVDTSVGMLMAWDPIKGESEWLVEHQYRWNAGVLTTAGGLVFQGNAEGKLVAYQAETGTLLWETSVGSGVLAPPVTYLVDGKQYVSVAVGWGGSGGQTSKVTERVYPGIIYTFALGGSASAPEYPDLPPKVLITGDVTVDASDLAAGAELYILNCNRCHGKVGSGGGALPDLAYSSQRIHENFKYIVQGSFEALGMPNFTGKITEAEISLIQQYIFAEAALVAGGN